MDRGSFDGDDPNRFRQSQTATALRTLAQETLIDTTSRYFKEIRGAELEPVQDFHVRFWTGSFSLMQSPPVRRFLMSRCA
jgi:hypothetical protein